MCMDCNVKEKIISFLKSELAQKPKDMLMDTLQRHSVRIPNQWNAEVFMVVLNNLAAKLDEYCREFERVKCENSMLKQNVKDLNGAFVVKIAKMMKRQEKQCDMLSALKCSISHLEFRIDSLVKKKS